MSEQTEAGALSEAEVSALAATLWAEYGHYIGGGVSSNGVLKTLTPAVESIIAARLAAASTRDLAEQVAALVDAARRYAVKRSTVYGPDVESVTIAQLAGIFEEALAAHTETTL